MAKAAEIILRFLDGETEIDAEKLFQAAMTDEGRKILETVSMLENGSKGVHPPPESLAVWPREILPGVAEHIKGCRSCRIQIIESGCNGRAAARTALKIRHASVEKTGFFETLGSLFKKRLILVPAGIAAAALITFALWAALANRTGFDFPPRGVEHIKDIGASSPLIQRGMGLSGRVLPQEANPIRLGYAAVWVRDAEKAGLSFKKEELEGMLGNLKEVPDKAVRKATAGRNPCGSFVDNDSSSLCMTGIMIASALDRGSTLSSDESETISNTMMRFSVSLDPALKEKLQRHPQQLTTSDLRELVFSILW